MIIKSNLIPAKGFVAMSISPFIFVRKDWFDNLEGKNQWNWKLLLKDVINHERIHARQQLEVLLFGLALAIVLSILLSFSWLLVLIPIFLYYVLYVADWLFGIISGSKQPYRDICFEKEAYANESDPNYLTNRRSFAFFEYF